MRTKLILAVVCMAVNLLVVPLRAANVPAKEGESQSQSLTEINKKLTNPVSDLWSIAFQQNNYMLDTGAGQPHHWNSNLTFKPVLPVALTENWNLITRPVITVFNSVPHPAPHDPAEIERTTGFGDTVLMELVSASPKLAGNWLLGVGPTFIFPTASSDYTGQGKWQVGPAAMGGLPLEEMDSWRPFSELDIFWGFRKSSGHEPDESSTLRGIFSARWLEYRMQWQHPGKLEGRQGR